MSKLDISSLRLDASESAFFGRQLEAIRPQLLEVKFAQLKAMSLVPVNTGVPAGAETFTYRYAESRGKADFITAHSSGGPRVDLFANEASQFIRMIGDSYAFNLQEIRASQMAGADLPTRKAQAARLAIAMKLDDIALLGDGTYTYGNLRGLFGLASTDTYTVPEAAAAGSGDTEWELKTADEILTDLNAMVNQIEANTKGVHKATTVVLPLSSYTHIANRRVGDGSNMTILALFRETQGLDVQSSVKLETAGSGSVKRAVAYEKSPDVLELILPVEFEQLQPERRDYEIITQCNARTAGVVCYYPKAVCYADGF